MVQKKNEKKGDEGGRKNYLFLQILDVIVFSIKN